MAFFEGPDLEQGRMLEDGGFPQQGLVPQLFANDVRYIPRRTVPRRSVVEIAKFGGEDKEDIIEWLDSWNRSVAANGWTPEEEQVMLPLYLVGRASQHYRTISEQVKNDIVLLKLEIKKHFNSPSQRLHFRNVLGERCQKPHESVADFYEDVCRLVQRGWSQKSPDFQREKSLEYFIKGLKPTIKKIFWGEEVEDIDVAYQKARTRELYLISKKGKSEVRAIDSEHSATVCPSSKDFCELMEGMKMLMDNQKRIIDMQLKNLEVPTESGCNPSNTRSVRSRAPRHRRMDIECWNCGKRGHFANKCDQSRTRKSETSQD